MPGKKYLSSDPATFVLLRWLPPVIVFCVVIGFAALSWYAYREGTQSLKDGELVVVQADQAPVKEKPANAGGMQFPDQDKTIFDTFSAKPAPLPKVERVVPMPAEPVAPPDNTSGTVGWVNDKIHKSTGGQNIAAAGAEQVIPVIPPSAVKKKQDVMEAVEKPMADAAPSAQEFRAVNAKQPAADDQTVLYVARAATNNDEGSLPSLDKEQKTALHGNPVADRKQAMPGISLPPEKPVDKVGAAATREIDAIVGFHEKPDNGAFKVQLGAYRSEKEARDAWKIMQKKHAAALKGRLPTIVKAELAKGTYYRLRIIGLPSSAAAKTLCGKLTAAGQACLIPAK